MAASPLIVDTAGMRIGRTAVLTPACVSSPPFIAAPAPDSKRLEQSVELLSVPLDIWSPTGAVGTVGDRAVHRSITSRSLAEAIRCPG